MKGAFATIACLQLLTFAAAFYENDSGVIVLEPASFQKQVPGNGVWLVEFYAPWCGHCKTLAPIYAQVAQALKGIVSVAAIDADTHKELAGQFGIQGFPSIKLISGASTEDLKVVDYKSDRSAQSIVEWAFRETKKIALRRLGAKEKPSKGHKEERPNGFYGENSDVVSLTDENFHEEVDGEGLWMIEFYAPWCGHCKNLKSDWEELASNVRGKAKIGAVDCTVQTATCQEYGVQGYPTIKVFGEDKDSPSDYHGDRDSSSMASFVINEWKKGQPPPEAKELVDQHAFERECIGDEEEPPKKLCLLAFLPNILDTKAAGRRDYIQALTRLAEKYVDRPFSYLWLEGAAQPALESSLGVGGYGYPAFVAVNPKDKKYASLREAFNYDNARHFIESLRSGNERVSSLGLHMPEIATVTPWDGGDGQILEEEEFSLEDLMGGEEDNKSEL